MITSQKKRPFFLTKWVAFFHQTPRHSAGGGAHHPHPPTEPPPKIPPYRKPVIPPNRPLAFTLSALLIMFAFSTSTGLFLFPAAPEFSDEMFDQKADDDRIKSINDVDMIKDFQ